MLSRAKNNSLHLTMRQISLVLSCLLLLTFFGCSHKYGINKTYAYTRSVTAGNIPVDQQNRPQTKGVQRTYLLYLEIEDTINQPQWDTAWVNSAAFTIQPLKIGKDSITIGKTSTDQKTVSLKAASGYSLWQLLLTPAASFTQNSEGQDEPAENRILLSGLWKGKRVNYHIKEMIELERIFME